MIYPHVNKTNSRLNLHYLNPCLRYLLKTFSPTQRFQHVAYGSVTWRGISVYTLLRSDNYVQLFIKCMEISINFSLGEETWTTRRVQCYSCRCENPCREYEFQLQFNYNSITIFFPEVVNISVRWIIGLVEHFYFWVGQIYASPRKKPPRQ